MNIIKSKYTSKQLKECYEKLEESEMQKNDKIINKVVRTTFFIINIPYVFWVFSLAYGILRPNTKFLIISLLFALIGLRTRSSKEKIARLLIEYHVSKNHFSFHPIDKTVFYEFVDHITCGEEAYKRCLHEKLSLVRKGDTKMILFTDENGKEEIFPLACNPLLAAQNTWDFSCYDIDIANLLEKMENFS